MKKNDIHNKVRTIQLNGTRSIDCWDGLHWEPKQSRILATPWKGSIYYLLINSESHCSKSFLNLIPKTHTGLNISIYLRGCDRNKICIHSLRKREDFARLFVVNICLYGTDFTHSRVFVASIWLHFIYFKWSSKWAK